MFSIPTLNNFVDFVGWFRNFYWIIYVELFLQKLWKLEKIWFIESANAFIYVYTYIYIYIYIYFTYAYISQGSTCQVKNPRAKHGFESAARRSQRRTWHVSESLVVEFIESANAFIYVYIYIYFIYVFISQRSTCQV